MPETQGYIMGVPELEQASEEERAAYVRSLVTNGRPPLSAPTNPAGTEGTPLPSASVPAGIFDPSVDFALESRSERYTLPGGKTVWVHPVSAEEAAYLNRQANAEVRALGLLRDDLPEDEAKAQHADATIEYNIRAMVWQVIMCCRQGPEADSLKVFLPSHTATLRRTPGYLDAIQEVVKLSDRLSAGKSEAALLKEGLAAFFGGVQSWLETCVSHLSKGSTRNVSDSLEDFAFSVKSMTASGRPASEWLVPLSMCLGVREEE